MKPAAIGARMLGLFLPVETARRFALPGFIAACVLALLAFWGAWQAFDWFNDRAAVERAADRANADFAEDFNTVTGEADTAAAAAAQEHAAQIRRTEELIDEALELGCTVSDYLHSSGRVCLQSGPAVRRSAAE